MAFSAPYCGYRAPLEARPLIRAESGRFAPRMFDRPKALHGPGESYGDVILRLAKG